MSTNAVVFAKDSEECQAKPSPHVLDLFLSQGVVSGSAVPDVEVSFQQGLFFHRQGDLSRAAAFYRQVLTCRPSHAEAWCHWGILALTGRNYPEALERFRRAISLCDTNPIFFNHYGIVLQSLRHYQEAKEAFETALTLNPDYADAWANIGQVMLSLKQDQNNIEHAFRQAIRLEPHHADAHYFLATLLLIQEKNGEALTHLEQAVAHCKTKPDYFYTYGIALKKTRRFDESLAALEAVIHLDPNSGETWWQIALLLHDLGRPPGPVEQALANVLRLQSNHGGAVSLLADVRRK
ncbi:MAG: tetratricopeptide repeat protein, partial [Planctomycetaceae bacterium]|nr:tetratricopeptide repeat protein [Planctomycetaceae bacterium]